MKTNFTLVFLFFLSAQLLAYGGSPHIMVDQFGYRPNDRKIAVISDPQSGFNAGDRFTPGTTYQVRNVMDNSVVYSGNIVAWKSGQVHAQSGDKVWYFDFSPVTAPGDYYLYDVTMTVKSNYFRIADDVYSEVLKHAMRTFFYQRSGFAKQTPYADARWTDGASHLGTLQDKNCRPATDPNNAAQALDLSGGWFDAGDYNKYLNFTYDPLHDLLGAWEQNPAVFGDDYNIPESGNGIPDILDEVKWELDWLLKMQRANGSVLMKVSVPNFQAASPPTADTAPRRYGEAASSATRTAASVFAHASIVYRRTGKPEMIAYADTLLKRAELAWQWVQTNPATSSYANSGFQSANPERTAYEQKATLTGAAAYLFAATGKAAYKTHFDNNYTSVQPYMWGYWYPFESTFQDALLYYTKTTGATPSVVTNIRNNAGSSVSQGNPELLPAVNNQTDAYKAYLKDDDHVWGSNKVKCNQALIMYNMKIYNIDPSNHVTYENAAEDYLHFMHGVNPINMVMLSNMYAYGGDRCVNEIYHGWFGDGTEFDNALTSSKGPAPGYVVGGFNKYFQPDGAYSGPRLAPPMDQPVLKSYKDWNTSYPENSWQITEPAIYYQAAYVKLLSKFAGQSLTTNVNTVAAPVPVTTYPNPASQKVIAEVAEGEITSAVLLNIAGQQVTRLDADSFNASRRIEISCDDLSNGIYFLRLRVNNREITEKIVVKK
jgi:endoglucanase